MRNIKIVSRITIFSALAIALGYVLSFVPNLELITSTIFFSGVLNGTLPGVLTGAISCFVFGFANPMGTSPLPLLLAQVAGGMFTGYMGGLYSKRKPDRIYIIVIFGIITTFVYDALTTLSGFFFFPTEKTFLAYLTAGSIFILWHILTQAFIYGAVIFPIVKKIQTAREDYI